MKELPTPETGAVPHVVCLSNRTALSVSGVQEVGSFDETAVTVYTSQGELTVTGTALHILHLNTETGELSVEGTVESLVYAPPRGSSGGFFGKLFR